MTGFIDGNRVVLLENGADYFPALEQAIDGAAIEIHLETYIFENDATGRRIVDALCRAAGRGVAVRVLVDGIGARPFADRLMPRLEASGVAVQIYRRDHRLLRLRRYRLRRMHRKLAVIDGRVAFVGGINIIDDVGNGGSPHPRFDYAVRVEGPLLRAATEAAHHLWWLVSWANLRRRGRRPVLSHLRPEPVGKVRAAFVIRDNLRHRRDIEDAYLAAIRAARSEVVIACAYFFPGRRFRHALTVAAARGVNVVLVLQGVSDHPILAYATRALYPYFLARRIRLFEYHRSQLHAKVAVIDRKWATVGSSNIDPFSLLLAREANVIVDDGDFAAQLRASLARAIASGASELRAEDWRRQPAVRRLASWLAYQCVRWIIGLAGYRGKH
ncbi:MAG TPA: cardiolipin synthase ClsB [Rhodocyclaceae bacterium]|nr:cardiolipin synthase ClsB [Rhodocyclaceae bacterium]